MPRRHYSPEEIIGRLRAADFLVSQGDPVGQVARAQKQEGIHLPGEEQADGPGERAANLVPASGSNTQILISAQRGDSQ